jgi:hypothetical protein
MFLRLHEGAWHADQRRALDAGVPRGRSRHGRHTSADGSAAPLLHSAHDDAVLDGSLGLYSTRRAVQDSCGSLYPRYAGRGSRILNTALALLCAAALNRVYVET